MAKTKTLYSNETNVPHEYDNDSRRGLKWLGIILVLILIVGCLIVMRESAAPAALSFALVTRGVLVAPRVKKQELIADTIWESDLILGKTPEIWDYCMDLAGRILDNLDFQEETYALTDWRADLIARVNSYIPEEALNMNYGGSDGVMIHRIKLLRQMSSKWPDSYREGESVPLSTCRDFVLDNWS